MKTAKELFADGLIASLELKLGSHYVILVDGSAVSEKTIVEANRHLAGKGFDVAFMFTAKPPKEAIAGIELRQS